MSESPRGRGKRPWIPRRLKVVMPRRATGAADKPDPEPAAPRRQGRPTSIEGPRERLQVWLKRRTRRRLRLWAALLDQDVSEVADEGLTHYLDWMDQERATQGLPPLPPVE